ncbi:MAG: CBS domain-containing protein [Candidatus Omnitrophica bacterium]|jgi:Mg/Co/Ni transporter MgtE|nr:CBS domain-containing protein [Candidatus Omnitrophota bacterium]MDD3987564.1 CBS domain-containing protein [Candidatus Omnitrophota bacterium]MDD4981970.1 CBS domain-containing protein [Candidatus Omnitrophota bacterium]MDD5665004.1 CBS domain-containing protein [Candidatus Omnitrophota bacterium]
MQVREVMSKEVIAVRRSMKLGELLGIFKDFHIFPLVPVVEDDSRLIGVVSFRNILDVFQSSHPDVLKLVPFLDEEEQNIFKMDISEDIGDLVVVQDIMDQEYIYIREDTSLEEVYKLMDVHLKEELPVVDRLGRLVGRVGIFDIIKFLFNQKGVMN